MKSPLQQRWSWLAIVTALAAVLIALGVLQYRWSREVSEAASVRMQSALHSSLLGWRQDFYRELASAGEAFQTPDSRNAKDHFAAVAQRYAAWRRSAAHPQLIADAYLLQHTQGDSLRWLRINKATGQLESAEWPGAFEQLRPWLEHVAVQIKLRARAPRPPPGAGHEHPGAPGFGAWAVAQEVPALLCPVVHRDSSHASEVTVDWFILQLDPAVLREQIFPELAERYFSGGAGFGYRVAIVRTRGQDVLYSSDTGFPGQDLAHADAVVNVFGPPMGPGAGRASAFLPPMPMRQEGAHFLHPGGGSPFARFEPIRYNGASADWQLVVRNRSGSLEAVAAALRRRNLAISFGVLLVLAATVAMILIASRRAQRLARLQMEFVAAVSHELRTPLTVISSAAENIADGVVDNRQQVMRYGDVIKSQAKQLIHIVEQVLLFSATREGAHRYHMQTLAVPDVVHAALETTAELVSAAGFTVEQEIAPSLPPIEGDMVALTQCLQNLVTNAVKYGGQQRWIGVRAALYTEGGREEIRISVSDRGSGIAREELEHIFQPFYRSVSATAAQIHGTGLGLPLAQSIAEAMNGRITVSSEPGKGSTFVLHLPVAAVRVPQTVETAAAGGKIS